MAKLNKITKAIPNVDSGGHHRISASGSSRWLLCTGSVEYVERLKRDKLIPDRSYNAASELGTAVHFIIEQVLLKKRKLKSYLGDLIKEEGMANEVLITHHELACAKVCIDYVKVERRKLNGGKGIKKAKMYPERSYDLTKVYKAPMGGTADVTIIEYRGTLHIIDYKNGRWAVDPINNSQLRIYALGAFYKFHGKYDFKKVKVTIVQPNDGHKDGAIRSETMSVKKLKLWEEKKLIPALKKIVSKKGKLVPGELQCMWCEGKTHCPARLAGKPKLLSKVMASIIPTTNINTLPEMHQLTEEQLEHILNDGDKIIKFYQEAKAFALKQLEEDRSAVNGWGIAPKLGNRQLLTADKLKASLKKEGISQKDITVHLEDRLMTVTELERFAAARKGWDKDDVTKFMASVTTREKKGYVMFKTDTAEDEFAEFAH